MLISGGIISISTLYLWYCWLLRRTETLGKSPLVPWIADFLSCHHYRPMLWRMSSLSSGRSILCLSAFHREILLCSVWRTSRGLRRDANHCYPRLLNQAPNNEQEKEQKHHSILGANLKRAKVQRKHGEGQTNYLIVVERSEVGHTEQGRKVLWFHHTGHGDNNLHLRYLCWNHFSDLQVAQNWILFLKRWWFFLLKSSFIICW